MEDFIGGMYSLFRAGKCLVSARFGTADEVFECVRRHRAGVYTVVRQDGKDRVVWGDVCHFGGDRISFAPARVNMGTA